MDIISKNVACRAASPLYGRCQDSYCCHMQTCGHLSWLEVRAPRDSRSIKIIFELGCMQVPCAFYVRSNGLDAIPLQSSLSSLAHGFLVSSAPTTRPKENDMTLHRNSASLRTPLLRVSLAPWRASLLSLTSTCTCPTLTTRFYRLRTPHIQL